MPADAPLVMPRYSVPRDVEWLQHKGRFNFVALTPKAREIMGLEIGGPWQMASAIFFYGVTPDKFDQTIKRLRAMGLNTDEEKADDTSNFTDF